MCGITGVVSLSGEGIHVSKLKSTCDVIAHRGPDGAGYLFAQTGVHHPRSQQYYKTFTEKKYATSNTLVPCIDEPEGERYLHQHTWDLFFGHRRLAILDLSSSGFQPISDLANKLLLPKLNNNPLSKSNENLLLFLPSRVEKKYL